MRTVLLFSTLLILLVGCSEQGSTSKKLPDNATIYTIEQNTLETDLFFSGTIAPLDVVNVTSPFEGAIKEKYFEYGQATKKGDKLATLLSKKFAEEYQTTLTQYLENKDKYRNELAQAEGKKMLWEAGITPDNKYQEEKSALATLALKQLQSESKLDNLIQQAAAVDPLFADLELKKFDLLDTQNLLNELSKEVNEIHFYAPTDGITLYPIATSEKGGTGGKEIYVGSEIKVGQVIVSIGDLSGISVTVEINEINLRNVNVGQPVIITGPAFPGVELHGEIVSVDSQARVKRGGLPTFPIKIVVPDLTPEQHEQVQVGMSAKIRILKQQENTVSIPIEAVFKENEKNWVRKLNGNNNIENIEVLTGHTTLDKVEIKQGLTPGDRIVIYD